MLSLAHILTIIVAFGVIGGFIDFYIGKDAQLCVKSWLETWWLKFSYVRWDTIGRDESRFAIEIMDRLFGGNLFSLRRWFAVSLATSIITAYVVVGGLILIGPVFLKSPVADKLVWSSYFSRPIYVYIIMFSLTMFLLALSFSVTRSASVLIGIVFYKSSQLNFFGVLLLILLQLMLIVYWVPLATLVRMSVFDILSIRWYEIGWWSSVWVAKKTIGAHFIDDLQDVFHDASITIPVEISKYDAFPIIAIPHIVALLDVISSIIRVVILMMFLCSFGVQMLRKPIEKIWLRVTESEQPVFTLLFGGVAAIAAIILAIVSNA